MYVVLNKCITFILKNPTVFFFWYTHKHIILKIHMNT